MSVANGFCYKMSKVKFSIVFIATDVGTLSLLSDSCLTDSLLLTYSAGTSVRIYR